MQELRRWHLAIRILVSFGVLLPVSTAWLDYREHREAVVANDGAPIFANGSRGCDVVLEIPVFNRIADPVRILGIKDQCLVSGCAKEALELPLDIEGHESRLIRVTYRIGREDEPPYMLTFYTTCDTQPEVTVAIRNKCTE